MAFSIKYARLFEVKILHGYYLDMGDGRNFYELDDNDTDDVNFRNAVLGRYNLIEKDLSIEPTEACRKLLNQHRMVFRLMPYGFMVGVEVKEQIQGNISSLFPRINIAEDTAFEFKIIIKDRDWHNYSAVRINPNVPAKFYFSNRLETDALTPPSLALRAAVRDSRYYEMGEFAFEENSGILYEAILGADSTISLNNIDYWKDIEDHHLVNSRNRMLLPLRFIYTFTPDTGQLITNASFVLNDMANSEVARIETSGAGPFRAYFLNFKALDVPQGRYTLVVSGNNGYQDETSVLLNEELYESSTHAVVSVGHQADLPDGVKLLEDDGSLRKENDMTTPPVFELRFPARKTYWRYFPHPRQNDSPLVPGPGADVIIDPNDDTLLSTQAPFPLTQNGAIVNLDTSVNILLPNPTNLAIKNEGNGQNGKYFSDIYLSRIKVL